MTNWCQGVLVIERMRVCSDSPVQIHQMQSAVSGYRWTHNDPFSHKGSFRVLLVMRVLLMGSTNMP